MQARRFTLLPATLALATVFSLSACDKGRDDTTAGQKLDATVAKVEQKSAQAGTEVKKDLDAARSTAADAMDATANKVKDAAITTRINAELARDAALSALKIDVDTVAGRVSLHGTAPDAAARERATALAQHVDGVVSVDNQLQVRR